MNAAFFDIDGTLFDTRADLAATVNHTRRDLSLSELPIESVIIHVGQGAKYLLEHAIPEVPENERDRAVEIFRSHYAEHCCESATLYPAVRSTLEELRRRGWKLGINTNKPAFAVKAMLAHYGIARFFDAVVAGGDCVEMKPSSLPLRECARRMGGYRLSAHDWMVGDNWTDLASAANAGIKSAFCTYGFGTAGDQRCNLRINRIDELLRYLKNED